jgi:hypothetical protein
VLGLIYAKDVDHLQNLVLVALRPLYTQCERKSGGWVCMSNSSYKRQKVDTQSLLVRHIVCGHFNVRERERALTVRGDVPSEVTHVIA